MQAASSRAGAYLSSWGAWASEKRRAGWGRQSSAPPSQPTSRAPSQHGTPLASPSASTHDVKKLEADLAEAAGEQLRRNQQEEDEKKKEKKSADALRPMPGRAAEEEGGEEGKKDKEKEAAKEEVRVGEAEGNGKLEDLKVASPVKGDDEKAAGKDVEQKTSVEKGAT